MKFLIAGLGNIGQQYHNSRHNLGFLVADAWAQQHRARFAEMPLALQASFTLRGRQIFLIKPTTYMNESGRAVHYWLNRHQVPLANLLVIVDDLALPFGVLRLRPRGSDGQHNGLTSVQQALGTTDYCRLRIGIGSDFPKGKQVDYVLGQWSAEQQQQLPQLLQACCDVLNSFVLLGVEKTMSRFNKKPEPPADDRATQGPANQ